MQLRFYSNYSVTIIIHFSPTSSHFSSKNVTKFSISSLRIYKLIWEYVQGRTEESTILEFRRQICWHPPLPARSQPAQILRFYFFFINYTTRTVQRCSPSIFRQRFRFQCRVLRRVATTFSCTEVRQSPILRGRSKNLVASRMQRGLRRYSSPVNRCPTCGSNDY